MSGSRWGRRTLEAVTVAFSLSIAACTVTSTSGYYVQPDVLAGRAATELAKSIGSDTPPTLTCGTERIRIEEGRVVDCILSVDGDLDRFAVTVTLKDVNGAKFAFAAKVASEPLPR